MSDWLAVLAVAAGLGLLFLVAWRNTRRQIAATIARRRNLTREEFLSAMLEDCSPEAATFLWDTALVYLEPRLTPHPDDDLVKDLPIDDDDWSMDWPTDFARQRGFHESNLPKWPDNQPVTIRNFGRWLSYGPV